MGDVSANKSGGERVGRAYQINERSSPDAQAAIANAVSPAGPFGSVVGGWLTTATGP
jgi:hypothetical protein